MSTQSGTSALFADADAAASALDQLFQEAGRYKSSREYLDLLRFTRRFPTFAPYNCFLLHMQNPGVRYVANAYQWRKRYGRRVKPQARPLIILVPFGPVDFVYDIGDTEGEELPESLCDPFKATGELPADVWKQTIANCSRDLIHVSESDMHSNRAGFITTDGAGASVLVETGRTPEGDRIYHRLPAMYRLVFNARYEAPAKYATLAHELGHLYCGHLGTPDDRWWPDRRELSHEHREFEAESTAYLVCARLGIDNPSARYLSGYVRYNDQLPNVSLEAVLKAAGQIERMGRERLKARKY